MNDDLTQYMTKEKLTELTNEKSVLTKEEIPALAKRIDEAREMGDLSENAEYHAARDEMAWKQSRVRELDSLISNAAVFDKSEGSLQVEVGSKIVVKINGVKKEYWIVGAQEAEPAVGKISNESPLGNAFLGKVRGDSVDVKVPSGVQTYKIISIE